jgi:hypothetical protein
VAVLALGFQACRKETFVESTSTTEELKNPITADAAEGWFKGQFGESMLVSPRNKPSSSFGAGDADRNAYFLGESFDITPLWSDAKISSYLKTSPILLVPVKPIAFLDAKKHHYTLVFFRDSLDELDARLQVYDATPSYRESHPKFDVKTFSGFFYQIHLNGKVDKVFAIDNGRFMSKATLAPNENLGQNTLKTRGGCDNCFYNDPTANAWNRFRCWVCDFFGGGGSNATIQNENDGTGAFDWELGFGTRHSTTGGVISNTGSNNTGNNGSSGSGYGNNTGGSYGDGTTSGGGYGGPNNNGQEGFVATLDNSLNNDIFYGNNSSVDYVKEAARQKYRNVGFSDIDFDNLWRDKAIFDEIDEAANDEMGEGFKEDALLYQKLMNESAEFNEFCNRLNTSNSTGGGSGDGMKAVLLDLAVDATQEVAESLLGIDDLSALRDLLEKGTEKAGRIAFKATRIIFRFVAKKNPFINAFFTADKIRTGYDKVSKAYKVIEQLNNFNTKILEKLIATLKKTGSGKILDRIKDTNRSPNLEGH